ncbi:MAG: tyrosine-protein phosphatase [Phycisphaerales bacterium]|nr:tyrosine-protein phosphatase [Planctomycetota bacterium]
MPVPSSISARDSSARGSLANALLFLLFFAGLALFYAKVIHPDLAPKRLAEVVPGAIYRSGELSPGALADLAHKAHLKTIIDLGIAPDGDPRDRRQQRTAQALGLTRYKFNLVGDSTGNPNEYAAAIRLALDPKNQPVLIHCATGSQRTSCAIALLRLAASPSPTDETLTRVITEARGFDAKDKVEEVIRAFAPAVLKSLETGDPIPGFPPARVEPAATPPTGP